MYIAGLLLSKVQDHLMYTICLFEALLIICLFDNSRDVFDPDDNVQDQAQLESLDDSLDPGDGKDKLDDINHDGETGVTAGNQTLLGLCLRKIVGH